jgi:hypothetical protein
MNAQNRAESASIRHEIDHLRHKTVAELKVRYLEVFGEASRSNHKQFLVRRIAWRLQALAEGNLSERARERALSLARDADLRLRAPQGSSGMATTGGRHRDARVPAPATILRRAFRDQNGPAFAPLNERGVHIQCTRACGAVNYTVGRFLWVPGRFP